MRPVALLRPSLIRPAIEFLERSEVRPPPLVQATRRLVQDPSQLIPITLAGRVFAEAARAAGTEAFGLLAARATNFTEMGDWNRLLARAPTIGAALDVAMRSVRQINSAAQIWYERCGDDIRLHHRFAYPFDEGRAQVNEYTLARQVQLVQLVAGPHWCPTEIWLESANPPHGSLVEALYGARVRFGQPSNAILFPAELARVRFSIPDAHAARAACAEPADDFASSMRQLVAAMLEMGAADLATAARMVCVSERTLQRRLRAVGLEFTELVDAARFEKARRMLLDRSVKIVEISSELGYTDSANFTRAFRRWAGVAPQAFRRSESSLAVS